ncbi:MAG TPA: DUF6491 family protein [Sphingomicrobium sp.]
MRAMLALIALCAAVAACAVQDRAPQQGAGSGGRQCFRAADVNNFWGATDDSVLVRTGVNQVYRLELSGVCHDIDWANRIALKSTGGSSWVCQGLDAEILVPSPIGAQRCLVTDIRKLSPEEAKAALKR